GEQLGEDLVVGAGEGRPEQGRGAALVLRRDGQVGLGEAVADVALGTVAAAGGGTAGGEAGTGGADAHGGQEAAAGGVEGPAGHGGAPWVGVEPGDQGAVKGWSGGWSGTSGPGLMAGRRSRPGPSLQGAGGQAAD